MDTRTESFWFATDGTQVPAGDPRAVYAEIVEYDGDGKVVSRAYGDVGDAAK